MSKRKLWKKIVTAALTGSVALSSIPFQALAANPGTGEAGAAIGNLIADFDFDEEAQGGFTGGGAKAAGSYELKSRGTGNALYLNGSQFLNVTAADGSSLLTGEDEITISYDAKAEKSEKSWTFFAAPDAQKQTYQKEKYLGVLHTSGKLQVERYNNAGARPGNNLESNAVSGWNHVDIVVTRDHTKLYVDGAMESESDSAYLLTDILGESSVLQIGKGNWDNGEFYKGYIDNYRIYDKALSEEEILEQYQEYVDANGPVQEAYNQLTLPGADDVRGNLGLIKEGKNGVSISWTSDNPQVVTDVADEESLYDGGIVTRPEPGQDPVTVNLRAELSKEGYEPLVKTFTVTVQPKTENLDTDYTAGYLWANFGTNGGYEKIFFGHSTDGLNWNKLNKDQYGAAQPILTNDAPGSDLGVRDPHLIRSPEGDKYWIIGTDLHAEGGGAGGSGWNQLSASQNIVVWESNDLVNWSEPRLVYAGFANAGCVWAPEAIYDETTGDYLVYWSARDKSLDGTQQNALRVYVCRTRDFQTFSEPKVWLSEDQDSGSEVNIIDTTIVEDNGKYYRFSTSDWFTVVDVSDTLDSEDLFDVRADAGKSTPNGSWTRLVTRDGSSAAGFDSREGFTVYKLPDGTWCAMGDHSGYQAFTTDDLSKGIFTKASVSFDEKFRHGTVVRLSKAEEERVLEAFKDKVDEEEPEAQEPVLEYNFDQDLNKTVMTDTGLGNDSLDNGSLAGSAKVVYDEERDSNVLRLDGSNGSYGQLPTGFFDGRNTMSISMDVKSELSSGNYFTFTYGLDNNHYNFLRVRGKEIRYGLTVTDYSQEQEVKTGNGANTGVWQKVILVVEGTTMKLYVDGVKVSENTNTGIRTSDIGTSLMAYLGKSFYSADAYFKGSFDNFKVYNRALTDEEILSEALETSDLLRDITIGTIPADPDNTMGTDDHTAVTSALDQEKKEITSYVRKAADIKAIPVSFTALSKDVVITANGKICKSGDLFDLSKDVEVTLTYADKKSEKWTIKTPSIATNPVLPGQYADPDIDYFDGKYWIYPTTDGFSGWGGSVFHAFSSDNLTDWTDEGIILDVKEKNPGENTNGVQIASSAWSDGNAWAPSIEEKDGKYYFYYCGNINSSYTSRCGSGKAIGVAVADNPAGPYIAQEMPIVYPKMCSDANIGFSGQVIDPSIFTDDDGKSYLFFGNGGNGSAMAELNEDMVTIKAGTLKKVNGMRDFRESVVVTKRNGLYHFTWSCDDTGSPNYHVNYGTAKTLDGNVTFRYTLLQKDEEGDMLGTAHQSILYMPETDTCYIAYHRFYTPLGIYSSGLGYHRETCIEEVKFDENGLMMPLTPTMEGARAKVTVNYAAAEGGSIQGTASQLLYIGSSAEEVTAVPEEGYEFVKWDDGKTDAKRIDQNVQKNQTYTAIFQKKAEPDDPKPQEKVTVTYIAGQGGKISGAAVQTIEKGAAATTVTAVADAGYEFQKWSDGKTTASRTDSNVQENRTYTAAFVKKQVPTPVDPKPESIKLNKKKLELGVKEKFTLKATVSAAAVSQKVIWKSSRKSVVSVSNGKLTAKKAGRAVITATTENGIEISCKVVVKKAPQKITLKSKTKVLKKGRSYQIKVKLPKGTASNKITYQSGKKSVAAVSATGKVTAKKKGTAVITVKTYNGKKARLTVRVK